MIITKRLLFSIPQKLRIFNSFSRSISTNNKIIPSKVSKKLHISFAAMLEIEKRKQTQNTVQWFNQRGWKVKQDGYLIQLQRFFLNKHIYIVMKGNNYPNKYSKQQENQQNTSQQQQQEQNNKKQSIGFLVYLSFSPNRQIQPTYLVIKCQATQEGVFPFSLNFTKNYQLHKTGKQTQQWNQLDDVNHSFFNYLKRYIALIGINTQLCQVLEQHINYCLKRDYIQWIKNMKYFIEDKRYSQ